LVRERDAAVGDAKDEAGKHQDGDQPGVRASTRARGIGDADLAMRGRKPRQLVDGGKAPRLPRDKCLGG
jgi:hypothetical protein